MSQITRCPACATSFRVVVDQLRIAQGWVRCGQCGEVFEAPLYLVHGHCVLPTDSVSAPDKDEPTPVAPDVDHHAASNLDLPASAPAHDALEGVSALSSGPAAPAMLVEREEIFVDPPPAADPLQADAPAPRLIDDAAAIPATDPDAAPEVSFVRDARRKAFWATPLMRGALGALAALLLVVLAVQWLMQQKDNLAALHPQLTPALAAFCGKLGCQVRPLRRIESLVIDSSNLSKTAPDAYSLSFVLKNTDAVALEIPALEVTLTNRQDQALVRRVLSPVQFGATHTTLAARSELPAVIVMNVSGEDAPGTAPLPVAGYRILAFYP